MLWPGSAEAPVSGNDTGVQAHSSDAPPVFAAAAVAGALFGWIDEWISRGMAETSEELERLAAEVEIQ